MITDELSLHCYRLSRILLLHIKEVWLQNRADLRFFLSINFFFIHDEWKLY